MVLLTRMVLVMAMVLAKVLVMLVVRWMVTEMVMVVVMVVVLVMLMVVVGMGANDDENGIARHIICTFVSVLRLQYREAP